MKRALPERKPARIRRVEPERINYPGKKPRQPIGDIDDYIFQHIIEKPVSDR